MNEQKNSSEKQESDLNPQVLLDAILELTESNKQVTRSILMLASAVREQAAAMEAVMLDEGIEDEGFTTLDGR